MAGIELWFPVAIYQQDNLFSKEQNQEWKDLALKIREEVPSGENVWEGNTYTTLNNFDIVRQEQFKILVDSIKEHVHNYARAFNSHADYVCNDGWLNVNEKNTFQEFHFHPNNRISAIYYIAAPEGSGKLVFEDPKEPDMMPLKNITEANSLSKMTAEFEPVEGRLILFRSYIRHLVQAGTNTTPRISAAFNFS